MKDYIHTHIYIVLKVVYMLRVLIINNVLTFCNLKLNKSKIYFAMCQCKCIYLCVSIRIYIERGVKYVIL